MEVKSFSDIDGDLARKLRLELGMYQADFWGELGIKRETGSNYEKRGRIPEPVQRLLFMRYFAGIPVNGPTEELARLGQALNSLLASKGKLIESSAALSIAQEQITEAIQIIQKQEKNHG